MKSYVGLLYSQFEFTLRTYHESIYIVDIVDNISFRILLFLSILRVVNLSQNTVLKKNPQNSDASILKKNKFSERTRGPSTSSYIKGILVLLP